jgi:hypothetical protein
MGMMMMMMMVVLWDAIASCFSAKASLYVHYEEGQIFRIDADPTTERRPNGTMKTTYLRSGRQSGTVDHLMGLPSGGARGRADCPNALHADSKRPRWRHQPFPCQPRVTSANERTSTHTKGQSQALLRGGSARASPVASRRHGRRRRVDVVITCKANPRARPIEHVCVCVCVWWVSENNCSFSATL